LHAVVIMHTMGEMALRGFGVMKRHQAFSPLECRSYRLSTDAMITFLSSSTPRIFNKKGIGVGACILAVTIVTVIIAVHHRGGRVRPRVVLWSWERPENLEFINSSWPREIAVAFLARTIRLRAGETIVKPRLQPLRFPQGTELIAVARIETEEAALSHTQLETTVSAINQLARQSNVGAIQIDFDAKESERPFYREMLQTLRQSLPAKMRLSITALASWCIHDDWLTGLPIDEAVPMLFRMGVERDEIKGYLAMGRTFRSRLCRNSLGVSTDEPLPRPPAPRPDTIYAFNPRPWSAAAVSEILKEWRE